MEKIKVFGYARKSPDDKEDTETSINNQIDLITNHCKKQDWVLVKIFMDRNVSGGDRTRKYFNEMLNEIKSTYNAEYIVVKDQNRFARDTSLFRDVLYDLSIRDKKVFSISKNKFLSHEDIGDMILSVVDEQKIVESKISTRILFEQKKEKGLPATPPPYGYRFEKKIKDGFVISTGRWIIVEKEAQKVREVINRFNNKENWRKTTEELNISNGLYYRILKNAKLGLYHGFVVYKHKVKDANKNVIKEEIVKYKGIHEPILL